MTVPSPFFDPEATVADLDAFLDEVDAALDGSVPAFLEHLLLGTKDRRDDPRAA
jgi:hypothetical protein